MSIGGVAPVEFSVNEGKYPYARVLRLYTNKQRETPAARELIQFVQAPRGQQVLAQTGFVPRP
jgi:ABC-type phosphate transport system substrate-binding protein